MTACFVRDGWLSEVMNRPVYRWAGPRHSPSKETVKMEMVEQASSNGGFFYVKWPAGDAAGLAIFTKLGFSVVDTPLTFEWRGDRIVPKGTSRVVTAEKNHFKELADLAENCFRFSRFHLDQAIPKELADLVKRRWLENYFTGKRGAALYAALIEDRVVGFLGVVETQHDSKKTAAIDLIGLSSEYQGRGIGSDLVCHFIREWSGRADSLRVGTQAANLPSIRLYEKTGFRAVASEYVLHAHLIPGGVFL